VVDGQVASRAVDPRAQVVAVGVARGGRPGAGERLLAEVLGGGAVADDPGQPPGERPLQLCEEFVQLPL
jgi:hypothetical protein